MYNHDSLAKQGWVIHTPIPLAVNDVKPANYSHVWVVSRCAKPYFDTEGFRYWYGNTLKSAVTQGCVAMGLSVPAELG